MIDYICEFEYKAAYNTQYNYGNLKSAGNWILVTLTYPAFSRYEKLPFTLLSDWLRSRPFSLFNWLERNSTSFGDVCVRLSG